MMPILKVENLSKDFVKSLDLVAKGLNKIGQNYKEEIVHAVDHVNFSIQGTMHMQDINNMQQKLGYLYILALNMI